MSGDLFGQSEPFSGRWPTSGSMRNGSLWARTTLVPATSGNGYSSSPGLLPTPAAGNFNDGESLESWEARRQANLAKGINGNGQGTPLAIAAQQLLPTPGATDTGGVRAVPEKRTHSGPDHGPRLRDVAPLLKTPTAQLAVNGGSQHPDKRREGGHGPTLADQVEHQLLPTPRSQHGESRNQNIWARPLSEPQNLENALARLPGEPTSSLSADGSELPAVPPPGQLSLDGLESD